MKYINSLSEIPKVKHWVVLVFGTTHIPGDERSRTNPGHGYPASTETKIDYIVFDDKSDLEKWVAGVEERKYGSSTLYSIIEAEPHNIQKTVKVI